MINRFALIKFSINKSEYTYIQSSHNLSSESRKVKSVIQIDGSQLKEGLNESKCQHHFLKKESF